MQNRTQSTQRYQALREESCWDQRKSEKEIRSNGNVWGWIKGQLVQKVTASQRGSHTEAIQRLVQKT